MDQQHIFLINDLEMCIFLKLNFDFNMSAFELLKGIRMTNIVCV